MKCKSCNKETVIELTEDFDTRELNYKNEKIIVKNVKSFKCSSCEEDWIESSELARVRAEIERQKYEVLSPELITKIRKALPITTKRELADFLCLNEKAFVKWEKGHYEQNRANDLLLRLIAFSKDNFEFVQKLHEKKFKFEASDYHFLKHIKIAAVEPQPVLFGYEANVQITSSEAVETKKPFVAGESFDYAMAA